MQEETLEGRNPWDPPFGVFCVIFFFFFLLDCFVIFFLGVYIPVPALGASNSRMEPGDQVGWGRLQVSEEG